MNKPLEKTKPRWLLALIPAAAIALLVAFFVIIGGNLFPGEFPPVEELTVGRVTLKPGEIDMTVSNGGPSTVTLSQVLVDEAYWDHTVEPSREITRLSSARVRIPYPWVEGEPFEVKLISSNGVVFTHGVAVATETPSPDRGFIVTFALLGIYIGLIHVLLGMTAMPFLRSLNRRWIAFFMALTAGVLIFLGIETVDEALEQADALPTAIGGVGVTAFGVIGSFALILAGARALKSRQRGSPRVVVAWLVAAGIGLHNLGEGLAVGAAWRLGEIALGSFLVIGFALHNTTEGIGIVSLLSDRKASLRLLLGLGAVAGLPTILGTWTSAFFFSPTLAVVFLAVAAGAIFEVVFEVMGVVREEIGSALAPYSLVGITVGIAVMYLTGLLVTA